MHEVPRPQEVVRRLNEVARPQVAVDGMSEGQSED